MPQTGLSVGSRGRPWAPPYTHPGKNNHLILDCDCCTQPGTIENVLCHPLTMTTVQQEPLSSSSQGCPGIGPRGQLRMSMGEAAREWGVFFCFCSSQRLFAPQLSPVPTRGVQPAPGRPWHRHQGGFCFSLWGMSVFCLPEMLRTS